MKKNVVLISILIVLFTFGLFIYDFSDELDKIIINNDWFYIENGDVYKVSFKDNKFTYLKNNIIMIDYENCNNYHYNSNNNVIKLGCSNKKSYIASYNKDTLTMTIDKTQRTYKSSLDLAYIEDFKKKNNLTDKEYASIIDINFDEYNEISISNLDKKYKNKKTEYIVILKKEINYENVFNTMALINIMKNTKKNFNLLFSDELTEKQLKKLNNYTNKKEYKDDEILIYELGNKKCNLKKTIKVNNKSEINNALTL